MRLILMLLALTACGDDSPAVPDAPAAGECTSSTKLNGPTVTCSAGYCVGTGPDYTGAPIVCKPKCADTGGACMAGQFFMTIQVSDPPPGAAAICYCEGQ